MNIYFVRHGEGIDDVYNEFGGWSDRELSPKGVNLAFTIVKQLKQIEKDIGQFSIVYTSPLKRSHETAQIIASELAIRDEELPYLKERNTYGLLSGVKKDIAKEEYPDMLTSFKNGKYIPGAERYKDFVERVEILMKYLLDQQYKNILCVTHGHLITVVAEECIGLTRHRIGNGCIMGVEATKSGRLKLRDNINISFGKTFEKNEIRKFKAD